MKLSLNKYLINKADLRTDVANSGFENKELDRSELAGVINLGHAFTCQLKGNRSTENFLSSGFAALDFDEARSLEEALADPYIQKHASLIYTTASHQIDGNGDRFRIVFELPEPIYDAIKYRQLTEGLLAGYTDADTAAKDPARLWFGSKDSNPIVMNGTLSQLVMDELITKGKEIEAQKAARRKECSYNLPIEEAEKMLTFIDPQPGYAIWRSICFALGNAYDEEAIPIIEAWSPDDKQRGRHLQQLIRRADGRITLGTVIYHAMQAGYQPPEQFLNLKRSPEQVAFEDIFNRGQDYIVISGELYLYSGAYYQKLSVGHCLKLIADYFYIYKTDIQGKTAFVTEKKMKDAYKFVLAKLYVDPDLVNPPGLNLKNGYLKLEFQGKKPVWKLLEHTPDLYHTYVADFEYTPDADTRLVEKILNDILDPPHLIVFLRTVSAIFNLPIVRKRQGRSVRALILLGVGSNGKDTLRVWTELLVGEYGLTTVGLRDFVKADSTSRFGLYSLAASLINWSSENDVVALDKCQNLKNFVTGDPITIEKKHKDGIVIKPKAVGIFNANEAPHVSNAQEAISSRYAFLEFPNKFVMSPRIEFPREKQGEPKFKEDPEFIKVHILPGYLKLLITAFKHLLQDGIDFHCTENAIESVRRDSNHFYQFIQETELVPCPLEEGLTPSEIYFRYEVWCRDNGLLNLFSDERKIWNDPSKFDLLVKNVRDITKRLRRELPDLVTDRNNAGRKIGLKFLTNTVY